MGLRIKEPHVVDFIVEKLDAFGEVIEQTEIVEDKTANGKLARVFDRVSASVPGFAEVLDQGFPVILVAPVIPYEAAFF
ncbi:MAG TPA: hypothetical protein PLF98_11415, partial [Thermotogota bacterium]|nr:hypothetical protein [Thermotogota bacterium]